MYDTQSPVIHRELARNTLNYFHSSEWYPGGGFFVKLMSACAHADNHNLDRLAKGFPDHVAAYRMAAQTPDGLAILRELAGA